MNKDPYAVIKSRYMTEKASMLQGLKDATSNSSLSKCQKAKYVFLVDKTASKIEIRKAVEQIYSEKNITVKSVNTINVSRKKRRVRGRQGYKAGFKKAIVTLDQGDLLDEEI